MAVKHINLQFIYGFVIGIVTITVVNTMFSLNLYQQTKRTILNRSSPNSIQTSNISFYQTELNPTENGEFMSYMEYVQKRRLVTLRKACKRMMDQTCLSLREIQDLSSHLHSKKYKFSLCKIYKVASSTWLKTIMVMEGYYKPSDMNTTKMKGDGFIINSHNAIGSPAKVINSIGNWSEYRKLITVRHPFERLVSAYTDKLIPTAKGYTYAYKSRSIRMNKKFRSQRHKQEDRDEIKHEWATFEDFLNSLLDRSFVDGHWAVYSDVCKPCSYEYNHIIKLETLKDDVKYLRNILNMTEVDKTVFFSPLRDSRIKEDLIKEYFSKIPKSLTMKVYEKYKNDFELFGYELPSWVC